MSRDETYIYSVYLSICAGKYFAYLICGSEPFKTSTSLES